jgi:hypothetical protein
MSIMFLSTGVNNGWSSEAWNKIVSEFPTKHTYVTMDKNQIQEKEKELKRDYKMLKEARMQSGASWNEKRCMIEAEPPLWDNIITVRIYFLCDMHDRG